MLPLPHNPTPTKRSGTKNAVFLLLPGGPKHASLQAPAEAHTATTPTLASEGRLHLSHHSDRCTCYRFIEVLKQSCECQDYIPILQVRERGHRETGFPAQVHTGCQGAAGGQPPRTPCPLSARRPRWGGDTQLRNRLTLLWKATQAETLSTGSSTTTQQRPCSCFTLRIHTETGICSPLRLTMSTWGQRGSDPARTWHVGVPGRCSPASRFGNKLKYKQGF